MRIRDIEERDIPILEEWHAQAGFDYPFPDLFASIFERVRVAVDEDDKPIQALAAKKTVEMYLLMDSTWRNPRWRLEAFSQIHEDMRKDLLGKGYQDVNAWLPPEVEKSFGRRLVSLFGWVRGRWQPYSRTLVDPSDAIKEIT